jgi:hypothetical protein
MPDRPLQGLKVTSSTLKNTTLDIHLVKKDVFQLCVQPGAGEDPAMGWGYSIKAIQMSNLCDREGWL